MASNIASVEHKKQLTGELYALRAVSQRDGFDSDSYRERVERFRTFYTKTSNKGAVGAKWTCKW